MSPPLEPARPASRLWLHVALFLATFASTTFMGGLTAASFATGFGSRPEPPLARLADFLPGLTFSVPLLAFLLAHEFGHYLAARAHGLRPSLPYFIPFPSLIGTMGAVIFFRGHFPNRRVLFDFAAAGPIAGFVVTVVVLALGLSWSEVLPVPPTMQGYSLGEPLLFQWLATAQFGVVPAPMSINMHPTAFAGWCGLFFTALNLIPVGQLDGGHVAYTVLGPRARWIAIASIGGIAAFALAYRVLNWIVWLVLILVLLRLFGLAHPPAIDEETRLDPVRLVLVLVVAIIFVISFSSNPISLIG